MKKLIWLLNLLLITSVSFAQVPTISSFSPVSGPIGTTVTITGTNFNATASKNVVYFGAVKANVTSASSAQLTVTVPVGTSYQYITVTDTSKGLTAYSNKPFIVTFPSSYTVDTSSLASPVTVGTASPPWGIAAADIDGDGKPDIVAANPDGNSVSIIRNTSTAGNISFASRIDLGIGNHPYDVRVADVDGDGKLDVIVTNPNGDTVSVFRNTSSPGNISFAGRVDFALGGSPSWVVVGDIDGDGKTDLVITNSNSGTISVLRNTSTPGNISFAPVVSYQVIGNPWRAAIADLDGDGKPDIIVGGGHNTGSDTIAVLRNTSTSGAISFAPALFYTAGSSSEGIAVGDIDGDGKPDIVVNNEGSASVSIFRNTSTSGNISLAPKVDLNVGCHPLPVAITDMDGDGKPDLVVSNSCSYDFSIFKNISTSGNISFDPLVTFSVGTYYTNDVVAVDFDGDGKPDLAVEMQVASQVWLYRNTVSAKLPPSAPQNLAATAGNGQVTLKWSKNTEADFLKYRIYRGTTSGGETLVDSTSAGITDTSRTESGLTNGTTYYFKVTAIDSARLESGFSSEVSAKPTVLNALYEYDPDTSTVLLLHMDETSGSTVADVSKYLNNGTAIGTSIVAGKFGSARTFGATPPPQEVSVSSVQALNFGTSPYTMECWINGYAANPCFILSKGTAAGAANISLTIGSDSTLQVNSASTVRGRFHIVDGHWHHVAVVGGTDPIKLFVDGQLDATGNITANVSNTYPFVVGAPPGAAYSTSAAIDEVRISNKVRSPQEFNLQLPPTNLSASVSGTTASLSWQNGGGAVPLMRYKIYRGTDSINVSAVDSTTSTNKSNTVPGAGTFYYLVSAVDSSGFEGAKSFAAMAVIKTAPVAPQNLAATTGNNQVTLKWTKNTESDFLRYRIYRGTTSGGESLIDSTSNGITDTSRIEAGLTNGTTYYFKITALDSARLESGFSNEVSAIPSGIDTIIVPSDITSGGGNLNNAIKTAISGGTLSNTVFELVSGGRYILDSTITVPLNQRLTIIAPAPGSTQAAAPPRIVWSSADTSTEYNFDCFGDISLKNVWLLYANTNGSQVKSSLEIEDDQPANSSGKGEIGTFEDVIFDYSDLPANGSGAVGVTCQHFRGTFTNCYFRNCTDPHYVYYGRAVSFPYNTSGWHTDTVTFVNCTFANLGYVLMQEGSEYSDHVWFNHCTFLNVMAFCLESSYYNWLNVNNSIFVNSFMAGDQIVGLFGRGGSPYPIGGTISIDSIKNSQFYNPASMSDASRHILFTNSSYFEEKWLTNWMSHGNSFSDTAGTNYKAYPQPMMNTETNAFFNNKTAWPYISKANLHDSTDPGFIFPPTNTTGIDTFLLGRWATGTNIDWSYYGQADVTGTWPMNESLSYTNKNLINAGMSGYPLGDLYHWFPSQYAAWMTQESQENATISQWLNSGVITGPSPSAPRNLSATPGNGQVSLSWSKNIESDFLRYRIYRGTTSGGETLVDSTANGITDTTRVEAGLTNGTTYYFRITAMNNERMESGYSNEVAAAPTTAPVIPSAPTLFTPSNGSTGVSTSPALSWNAFSGATSYRLQVSTDSTFGTTKLDSSKIAATSLAIKGLSAGTKYFWHVNASGSAGTSAWSTAWSFTVAPIAVVSYKSVQSGNIKLVYTVKTSESINLSKLEYSTDGGTSWSSTGSYSGSTSGITGTKSDTIYWNSRKDLPSIESKAIDLRFTFQSTANSYSVVVDSVGVDNEPPRNLSVNLMQYIGWRSVMITLNAPTDMSPPIKYNFYFLRNGSRNSSPDISTMSDTLMLTGLRSLVDTSFIVRAQDSLGNEDTNTVVHDIKTRAVGQFDGSSQFDDYDMASFMSDWSNGDTVNVDMYPFTGNFPNIIVTPNKILNVDDIYVFAKMWLYSYQHPSASSSKQSASKVAVNTHVDSTMKLDVDRASRNSNLSLSSDINTNLISCGVQIAYGTAHLSDNQPITVDSISFVGNGMTLVYNDTINKNFYADYGLASGFNAKSGNLVKLKMKIPKFADNDSMIVSLVGYDSNLREALSKTYSVQLVDIPSTFALYQNYPNPFNPSTTIQFDLPKPERVKLIVYNVIGQKVQTLANANFDAGTYKVVFDGFRYASGVYFYVINAGTNRTVKKMMLLK